MPLSVKRKRICFFLILLFPLGVILTWLSRLNPQATEAIYSQGIYPVLMTILSNFSSLFPYSLMELIVITGSAWLVYRLFRNLSLWITQPTQRKEILLRVLSRLAAGGAVVYFVFVFTCGINYSRLSFAQHSGLPVRPSTTQELYDLCDELLTKTNAVRQQVTTNVQGVMTLSEQNMYQLALQSREIFQSLSETYPCLGGHYSQPKPLFGSRLLSHFQYLGIFACFTGEPVINVAAPDINIPVTMCHEQAHLRGFMREDEANFIAYLACVNSQNPDFVYSGLVQALIYSTNALYDADPQLYQQLRAQYSPGLVADLADDATYWDAYESKVSQAATAWNDTYLKANQQTDGVQSYGRMVDLLLADYRLRHGLD